MADLPAAGEVERLFEDDDDRLLLRSRISVSVSPPELSPLYVYRRVGVYPGTSSKVYPVPEETMMP
eukprot:632469-Rhodomonas_salina.1